MRPAAIPEPAPSFAVPGLAIFGLSFFGLSFFGLLFFGLSGWGLSLFASVARAETPGARRVTFAAARAAGESAAPDVALAAGRDAVTRAQIGVAGALANPTLGVTTARETARLGVSASLPLPVFGQRGAALAAARSDADAAALDVEAARAEGRFAASVAWLDLWEAEGRARLFAEAAADAARVAAIADEKFKAGSAPRVDVLRTAADRARARADADFAAAAVPAASARLAIAMGDPTLDRARASASAEGAADLELGLASGHDQLADLLSLLPAHPAARRDRARAEAAAAHVRAEQRLRWPIVNAELAVNWRDPTLPATDVIGGLAFEAPVLSLRGGAIARARAEQALEETTAALELRRLQSELTDAYARAQGAGARARSLRSDVLPALEEVRRMTEEGYRDGRVDLLRLLDAQRARLDSRLAQVEAQAAWERALAEVERAVGRRLDGRTRDGL
ncbi:MAG TPA: TolC family protein [Polyangia bacterium]|nr:TolC family protein [Polyangia bacterium]